MSPKFEELIGERIKAAADKVGGLDQLARMTGVKRRTMYDYASGHTEPKISTIVAIAKAAECSIDWIATGHQVDVVISGIHGEKTLLQAKNSPRETANPTLATIDQSVFKQVGRLVAKVHADEGIKLPTDALLDEQSSAYNTLIERAEDTGDTDELFSLLPWLEARLRKRLKAATAQPGSGKQQA